MNGRHFTIVCNHNVNVTAKPLSTVIGDLLQLLRPVYEAHKALRWRYDWYRDFNVWEEFKDPTPPEPKGLYAEIPPGFVATVGAKALRFHIPVNYERLRADPEHLFALRSFFEAVSMLLQSGFVLYAPCGKEFRDQLTEWVIDGMCLEEIESRLADLYGLRACPVVPRTRRNKKQIKYQRPEAFDRSYETVEIYKDGFEDIKAADLLHF